MSPVSAAIGHLAAGLIATGIVIPLVEVASLSNFAGYVSWCVWLLGVAVLLFRAPAPEAAAVRRQEPRLVNCPARQRGTAP